jgi:hypothetical protein
LQLLKLLGRGRLLGAQHVDPAALLLGLDDALAEGRATVMRSRPA